MFDDSDRLLSVFKSKYSVGHRHLESIDCSFTLFGRSVVAYKPWHCVQGKSIPWPWIQHRSVFYLLGNISNAVNKAWSWSGLLLLVVYGLGEYM